ncbi:MAG: hypothetical protein KKE20_01670, partial [Nanoarchaeota archaeon]|nr:hypothetical protein [Nanoarchaeota archaeon]
PISESEVNHAKIHSDLIEKPDLSRILQERGVSQEVIARFKDKLEEFLEYSDSRIESHPKVTNIDCYLENWISDQYASLVKIDNGTFRSAPPQMDLAQALDYSNFFTYKHQKSYLKDYLKKNKGKYSKKEFIEIYDHCCFYRGLKNIIMADRYIQRGGNSDRYMYHAVNCFYKASAALRRINKRESKQFKELENIMFDMYRTLRK